jgi:uncharacterized protein (TIGR00725 family)
MTGAAGSTGVWQRPARVSVVGAGRASPLEESLARDLGRALGAAGAVVITGGLGGVMEAVSRGCIEGGGETVGLLPGTDPGLANPWVTLPLATGLGEARNALVVRAGEVVLAVGGSWGTLSEIALARKMGRDVALLGDSRWSLPVTRLGSAAEAAAWALDVVARRRTGT